MASRLDRPPGSLRPSLASSNINTASHPNLTALAASTAIARKASLNALTAGQSQSQSHHHSTRNTMLSDLREIAVGHLVDVPGAMHGMVKFIGPVQGKKGVFAGVELSKEYASRGKNDGDVDGYVVPAQLNSFSATIYSFLTLFRRR
jgi:hypothetical protein